MAQAAWEAKADELVVLNLQKLSFSFDYFFLCSASSERRIQTVAQQIQERLSESGVRPAHLEGRQEGGWVLLDCGAVVGHVFSQEARHYYQLERLWADAPRLSLGSILKRSLHSKDGWGAGSRDSARRRLRSKAPGS